MQLPEAIIGAASAAELSDDGWAWNAVQGNLLDHRFPGSGFYLRGFEDGIARHLWFGLKATPHDGPTQPRPCPSARP